MNKLSITICPVGPLQTNCYLLANGQTREAVIIDPGAEAKKIRAKCDELNLKPAAVLLTHGHFDHIMAADELRQHCAIPILAGEMEKELLANAAMNGSGMIGKQVTLSADRFLSDNEQLDPAGIPVHVIHTPGHTAGGICFYLEDENVLISGDTLFQGSFGRTDLPTGDMKVLTETIMKRLFTLPGKTVIYPGHGGTAVMEKEKQNNMIWRYVG